MCAVYASVVAGVAGGECRGQGGRCREVGGRGVGDCDVELRFPAVVPGSGRGRQVDLVSGGFL